MQVPKKFLPQADLDLNEQLSTILTERVFSELLSHRRWHGPPFS